MEKLIPHSKYKQRSHETSLERHLVELQNKPEQPSIVLLGDSMIERMITTGLSPSFDLWPSTTMIGDETNQQHLQTPSARTERLQGVFNAGVGGDKFENVIYRLTGSSDPLRPLGGLLDALRNRDVKLWVLHVGTNNLHPKRGMRESDLALLRLIVEALLEMNGKILLIGLFRRKDIRDELIVKANESYVELVRQFQEDAVNQIEFLEPPLVDMEECLVDHVHLNERGYQIWAEVLFKAVTNAM
ncbi:SGNH hydrolase-type esterase domain-containing protein [Colletotrichum acutatum]|uniref:SGNH hydrolase-type esterase domain-containing protein n=1 Tax=Glomerella acutata TaxID=27357 RepID=A0AAD8U749_GLOAC|nr:SGNH hydrolase-type esterase domain-containing protein [Colletotrichum acutatum]KAK1710030.1 SGNH hydrolase-type esterase domain-containing protein [Colletotrichum acutatum]